MPALPPSIIRMLPAAWTMEKMAVNPDTGDGAYNVYCDGYKYTMSFEADENDDSMITQTNAHIRLVFHVSKEGVTVVPKGAILK